MQPTFSATGSKRPVQEQWFGGSVEVEECDIMVILRKLRISDFWSMWMDINLWIALIICWLSVWIIKKG